MDARGRLDTFANSEGRSGLHIAEGVAICAGAVLVSALIARKNAPTRDNPTVKRAYDALRQPVIKPPAPVFAIVWPPLFALMTISGIRVWNAPPSPARSRALMFWSAVQGLNALWMAMGPKHLSAQRVAAGAVVTSAVAYMREAQAVDTPAAGLFAPFLGWISYAEVLTNQLWKLNRPQPAAEATVH